MNSQFYGDAIFWIETDKIVPNPYQPRREFDDAALKDLSESIRMYGILQPLVVTRKEIQKEDGGLSVEYELISGERRLRASKLAGVNRVPALIRAGHEDARVKLELAIIENLQREDLNPVDRARSFERLANEFGLKHAQIAEKVGKSREYVTNTMRILSLPESILNALGEGKISEGHTRPLLMLADKPAEQETLLKEIVFKKLTVREAEAIARKVAVDRVRKKEYISDPSLVELEKKFNEHLGTRVHIEKGDKGGKLTIDFFSTDDLQYLLSLVSNQKADSPTALMDRHIAKGSPDFANKTQPAMSVSEAIESLETGTPVEIVQEAQSSKSDQSHMGQALDDRPKQEILAEQNTEELYSIKNFGV